MALQHVRLSEYFTSHQCVQFVFLGICYSKSSYGYLQQCVFNTILGIWCNV
jgi:hypothetical protein